MRDFVKLPQSRVNPHTNENQELYKMATNTSDAAAHTKELREDLDALRADMDSVPSRGV